MVANIRSKQHTAYQQKNTKDAPSTQKIKTLCALCLPGAMVVPSKNLTTKKLVVSLKS
jgi:hypothetical protein